MNVYTYVAEDNPIVAQGIIESFGYEHANTPDMGLSQLVAKVGEPALKKIMENHPDKEVILEMFSVKTPKLECECGCKNRNRNNEVFLNANGGENVNEKVNQNALAFQTNVIIGVTALFLATALFLKK